MNKKIIFLIILIATFILIAEGVYFWNSTRIPFIENEREDLLIAKEKILKISEPAFIPKSSTGDSAKEEEEIPLDEDGILQISEPALPPNVNESVEEEEIPLDEDGTLQILEPALPPTEL